MLHTSTAQQNPAELGNPLSKGLFIVFEGIDGSGTTTQCHLLAEKVEKLGGPVIRTREPGGTPLAESIRALILDPKSDAISDLTELLLYAASRAQHVSEKIKPSLGKGIHVICDRFTASTWAYQGYGRNMDLSLIGQVTKIASAGCEPDLTFYLKVPVQVATDRRAKRSQGPDRLELEGDTFQLRVAAGYEKLAGGDTLRGVVLDGSKTQEEISCEVWENLLTRWPHFPSMKSHDNR